VMVEAEQYGAKVEFVEIQDDSFEGQVLAAVLAIVARVEHKRIKERVAGGKRRRVLGDAAKGKPARLLPGNVPRYGWRYADTAKSRYVLHPVHAAIMERIYRELGEDGHTLNAICRDLEADGILPPTEALAREGYDIGKRKVGAAWNASSVARMLKEPCYWGEAVAYRYEAHKTTVRDAQTNRVRRVKRTRYRDTESDAIVRYPPEVWPGIVSKELAMKALARLAQNRIEGERNSKHAGMSFLRAGLLICGYCGANMLLHNHTEYKGGPETLRFVCGRYANFVAKRPSFTEDCPAGGLVSVRVDITEAAVWGTFAARLSDPDRIPTAYAALKAQDADVRAQQQKRTKTLTTLIEKAQQRRLRLVDMAAGEADAEMRAIYQEKIAAETASIHTWEAEREAVEREASEKLAETAEVREAMDTFAKRFVPLMNYSTARRRKLAQLLHLRVAVYRQNHLPWIEMACDLPGIEASWHAEPLSKAGEEAYLTLGLGWGAHLNEQGEALPNFETRSPHLRIPIHDDPPQVSERVLKDAINNKWTAVIPGQEKKSAESAREPVSAGAGQ
jgi:Recombinase/Recombinase zinc beta ribbon domain